MATAKKVPGSDLLTQIHSLAKQQKQLETALVKSQGVELKKLVSEFKKNLKAGKLSFSVKTAALRKAAWRKQGKAFTAKALVTADIVSAGEAIRVTRTVTLRAGAAAAKKAKIPGS